MFLAIHKNHNEKIVHQPLEERKFIHGKYSVYETGKVTGGC